MKFSRKFARNEQFFFTLKWAEEARIRAPILSPRVRFFFLIQNLIIFILQFDFKLIRKSSEKKKHTHTRNETSSSNEYTTCDYRNIGSRECDLHFVYFSSLPFDDENFFCFFFFSLSFSFFPRISYFDKTHNTLIMCKRIFVFFFILLFFRCTIVRSYFETFAALSRFYAVRINTYEPKPTNHGARSSNRLEGFRLDPKHTSLQLPVAVLVKRVVDLLRVSRSHRSPPRASVAVVVAVYACAYVLSYVRDSILNEFFDG